MSGMFLVERSLGGARDRPEVPSEADSFSEIGAPLLAWGEIGVTGAADIDFEVADRDCSETL